MTARPEKLDHFIQASSAVHVKSVSLLFTSMTTSSHSYGSIPLLPLANMFIPTTRIITEPRICQS